jgi:hypothetical protein
VPPLRKRFDLFEEMLMTSTLRRLRTFAMAAAIALYADVASPQSAGDVWLATVDAEFEPQVHDHQGRAEAAPSQGGTAGMAGMPRDVMARMAALDERIRTLATDMHMFTGELKVETMATLLTALVERQSLMAHDMRRMHGEMMRRMMERRASAASPEEEPGTLCAPSP